MIANSLVEPDRAHLLHPAVAPRVHERQLDGFTGLMDKADLRRALTA